jgi:hypothetical protein
VIRPGIRRATCIPAVQKVGKKDEQLEQLGETGQEPILVLVRDHLQVHELELVYRFFPNA